jgi:predicted  nucleic acid-binding Zn-ribbon protein
MAQTKKNDHRFVWDNLQMNASGRVTMARDRTLKKVTKVMKRVEKHIEDARDALEDLEIEFEVLKSTVKKLTPASTEAPPQEEEEVVDIENTTNSTTMQKF